MLRLIKAVGKSGLTGAVRLRLNHLPLSLETAEWYAALMKRWPGILPAQQFQVCRQLPAGMKMNLGVVDVIERTLRTTGTWDAIVQQTMEACVSKGDVFLDVGANIGYFSLLASRLVGKAGRVVSFEPSARALAKLAMHVCLNQCENVTLCSQALGAVAGSDRLQWATSSNIGGSTIARRATNSVHSEPIAIRRLDAVCAEMAIRPSFIKLDVEGFELFALQGAVETLRKHRPQVICELTPDFLKDHGQSGEGLLHFMSDLGYQAYLLELDLSGRLVASPCPRKMELRQQVEVLFSMTVPDFILASKKRRKTATAV